MKLDNIMKLVEKRAKGFSYQEIQEEFAAVEEKPKQNILPQDEQNTGENNKHEKKYDAKNESGNSIVIELPQKRKKGRPKKCEKEKPSEMVLVKKRVHTFFVPPDMIAIKMLYDMQTNVSTNKDDVMDLAMRRKELLDKIKEELIGELDK